MHVIFKNLLVPLMQKGGPAAPEGFRFLPFVCVIQYALKLYMTGSNNKYKRIKSGE